MSKQIDWKAGKRKNQIRIKVDQASFHSFSNAGWRSGNAWTELGRKKAYFYKTIPQSVIDKMNKQKITYKEEPKKIYKINSSKRAKYNLQSKIDKQRNFRKKLNRIW